MNQQHPNLKYTIEELTNALPFLDVEIELKEGVNFSSKLYRKKTNTGVYLNSQAAVPNNWKTGLIVGELNRAWRNSSSEVIFNEEVENLRQLFAHNGYNDFYFNQALRKFRDNFIKNKEGYVNDVSIDSEQKDFKVFKVPFVGEASYDFKKKFSKLVESKFPIIVKPVFNSVKVGNYFNLKCKTPFALTSNVIYKYTCCSDAKLSYIGKTKRHLVVRADEHLTLEKDHKSEVKEHIKKCNACKSGASFEDNFSILRKCRTNFQACISEALLIKRFKPNLNKQLFQKGAFYTLKVF